MNDYLQLAAAGWLIAIPLLLAVWHSPTALLKIKRRLVARADGLTASRAAYNAAHDAAMRPEPITIDWNIELEGHR